MRMIQFKKMMDDFQARVFSDYHRLLEAVGAIGQAHDFKDSLLFKDSPRDLVDEMVKACQAAYGNDVRSMGVEAQEFLLCIAPLQKMHERVTQIVLQEEAARDSDE